jgi:hypothetical protein
MAVENQSSAASINVLRRMNLPVERERISVTSVFPMPEVENLCPRRAERESRSLFSARVDGDGVRLTSAVALIASSSASSLGVYVSSIPPWSERALLAHLNTTARAEHYLTISIDSWPPQDGRSTAIRIVSIVRSRPPSAWPKNAAPPFLPSLHKSLPFADYNLLTLSTGDVLLFGLAKEQHAVTHPSYPTELVIIGDDVAVPRKQGALVGRRGLAGTILAYKCASAVADQGGELDECKEVAEAVGGMLGTIGAGLNHCHVGRRRCLSFEFSSLTVSHLQIPGTATQESHLQADQVEIGMGTFSRSSTFSIPH